MKTNVIKDRSKKVMAGFLAAAIAMAGIVSAPRTAEATDTTEATVYFATTTEYSMSDYWSADTKKVPVKEGYVFAGWYNANKTNPLKQENLQEADNDAIAKFVPAEVLSVKTQAAFVTGDNAQTATLRILSSVDSLNYQEVGFEYKLGALSESQTTQITTVYSAIKPYKDATWTIQPGDTFVEGVSKYFIAADVPGIRSTSYDRIVYARPYWVTMDGTKVTGLARNNRVEDTQNNNQYTSVSINLLTDGKTSAGVAAGIIQLTYNTEYYDVVGKTADIAYDSTKGGKYLFSEMECYVDEEAGTVTFVGNTSTVDTNLTADGLFANVRFVKSESNTENNALDFEINKDATEFCNWEEKDVTTLVVQ